MAYKQVRKPNLDPVIYQGGKALGSWLGYCLAYVETAFSTGWTGSIAIESYNKSKKKHTSALPKGVYVPIWFNHRGTYKGVTKEWGHVAIYKDGKIWSSPLSNKPYADTFTSVKQIEQKYSAKYLGWSEDIAGVIVVNKPTVKTATAAQVTKAYNDILKRKVDSAGLKHYTTNGMTEAQVRADLMKSDERKKLLAKEAAQAKAKAAAEAKAKAEAAAKKATEEAAIKAEAARKAKEEAERLAKEQKDTAAQRAAELAEENNGLLKQILALLKSIFNR